MHFVLMYMSLEAAIQRSQSQPRLNCELVTEMVDDGREDDG